MVSILMPVKNAAPFLEACIDSIIQQSVQDWELIAIDDGSEDTSLQILRHYALEDSRIIAEQNLGNGIIDALRQAYTLSTGKYITRMDADDRMSRDKLELMEARLSEIGLGFLAVGLVEYFSEIDLGSGYARYAQWLNRLTLSENNYLEIYKECVIPSPCWMCHRIDFENSGAFNSDRYPEDYDLCFRFYKSDLKISAIHSVLHYWRDHPDRASRNDPNYLDNRFFDIKMDYFIELELEPQSKVKLLGAGKKAKVLAKMLLAENVLFEWYTNNVEKVDKTIYGVKLKNQDGLLFDTKAKIIIAISNPDQQRAIRKLLDEKNFVFGKHFFFFS